MKKLIIFFITMVLMTTISIMETSKNSMVGDGLSEKEIETYRESLKEKFEKKNVKYTDKDLEKQVEKFKKSKKRQEKREALGEAFQQALKISAVVCGIVAIIFFIKGSYYNELLGSNIWMQGRQNTYQGKI